MSRPTRFNDAALAAALSAGRAPLALDREGRVRLIGEAAEALLRGAAPSREAALFLGGALLAWLQQGGNLEKDFFKTTRPKSHHTASVIWRGLAAHRNEGGTDPDGEE